MSIKWLVLPRLRSTKFPNYIHIVKREISTPDYCHNFAYFFAISLSLTCFKIMRVLSNDKSFCFFPIFSAGKPQIVEKTDTSVTIGWTKSTKIGASNLQGYTIEMFGRNDTEGWVAVANRVQNTTYTQHGLTAGISYFFVVRAENSHGMSVPSPLSESIIIGVVSRRIRQIFTFSLFECYEIGFDAVCMWSTAHRTKWCHFIGVQFRFERLIFN